MLLSNIMRKDIRHTILGLYAVEHIIFFYRQDSVIVMYALHITYT